MLQETQSSNFKQGLNRALALSIRTERIQHFDTVADLKEINEDFMSWYEQLEPFGKDFPQAIVKIENVLIAEKSEIKGGHLRLTFKQGRAFSQAIYFNPNQRSRDVQPGDIVELFVEPQWNHFRGDKRLQLQIKSLV